MVDQLQDGIDTERIRAVSQALTLQAGKVTDASTTGTSLAGTLAENWLGNDSEQFASQWQDATRQLQSAQTSLEEYARAAGVQADQQTDASGGSGGSVPGGGGGRGPSAM